MEKRRVSFLLGIVLLLFVFVIVVLAVTAVFMTQNRLPLVGRAVVGLVKVEGVIVDTSDVIRQLRKYAENSSVRAIVLRVNSPGGSVGGSQELYSEILKVREQHHKPVVASMGNVAASGGYYVACAADEVFANPGTLTGSIGVIFQAYNIEGATRKLGVGVTTVKSGKFKDTGSMFREMTPDERKLIQGTIDDTYDQFLDAVMSTRQTALARAYLRENAGGTSPTRPGEPAASSPDPSSLPPEIIRSYLRAHADGRVLTGRQAKAIGLIDSLGTLQDAIDRAAELAHITGKPVVLRERRKPSLWDLLESRAGVLSKLAPHNRVSLEYRLSFD